MVTAQTIIVVNPIANWTWTLPTPFETNTPDTVSAGTEIDFSLTGTDASGNPVAGVTYWWYLGPQGGTLTNMGSITSDSDGVFSWSYTITQTKGTYTLDIEPTDMPSEQDPTTS